MPLRFGVVLSLAIVALTLVACDNGSETVRVTDRYTLDMLGAGVSLTEERCDFTRMGQLLYVGDSSSIYYCTGKAWKKVNGKDGKDGRDGKDGEDGTDGKRGEYGISGTECFIEKFTEGFVLGCGATKAVVRYDFEIPDTCSIKFVADSSYVLACGDESVTLIQGPQGVQGASCVQTDIGGGRVKLACGNDSVTTYKAQCGETPFDPDGSQFCYGDTLVERCDSHVYDIKKQFCYSDSLVNLCAGNAYELNEQFCYNDSLVEFCAGKVYDLSVQFCYNDSIVSRCNGRTYDLETQFCSVTNSGEKILKKCSGEEYDRTTQFCYKDSLVDLCGGKSYDLKKRFCYSGSLVDLCGDKPYDLKRKFCYNDSLISLCGGKSYDIKQQFCSGGTLVDLCGGKTYDLKAKFCYNDSLVDFCGGKAYDLKAKFCYNDSLVNLCGGKSYDIKEQFCSGGTLVDLCGGKTYELKAKFCYNDSLVNLCGGKEYDVKEQFCSGGTLVDLCGGETYDLKVKFCYNDSLVNLCGGKEYDVKLQFCYNNTLINLCGSETYDPKVQFCHNDELFDFCAGRSYDADKERCSDGTLIPRCPAEIEDYHFCDERNGKVYRFTVIGSATWMAQDLDYKVPNSFCENVNYDDSLYCKRNLPGGRYYPWSVAMARPEAECGDGHKCTGVAYLHQGVCPDGWHLPSVDEWEALIGVMGKYNSVYWADGENSYGFSAIPTGIIGVSYSANADKFNRGTKAQAQSDEIWTSTEESAGKSYLYFFYKDGSYGGVVNKLSYSKSQWARTVRCVKN